MEFQPIDLAKENYKLIIKSSYFSSKLNLENLKLKALKNSEIVFNNEFAQRIMTPENFDKYHETSNLENEQFFIYDNKIKRMWKKAKVLRFYEE